MASRGSSAATDDDDVTADGDDDTIDDDDVTTDSDDVTLLVDFSFLSFFSFFASFLAAEPFVALPFCFLSLFTTACATR